MAIAAVRALRWTIRTTLQALLAIIILFEEWGWTPLARALATLGRLAPVAWLEAHIRALPPYWALAVFVVPSILIIPLKLVALWLITGGHVFSAGMLFLGAKVVGTAIVARLFQLTEPALMQLSWFRRVLEIVIPWKDALIASLRDSWVWRSGHTFKERLMTTVRRLGADMRSVAQPAIDWVSSLMRRR
jgi:hypothetical protein